MLVQLTLLLVFGDRPSYPVICLVVTSLALSGLVPLMLWRNRAALRTAPRAFRRHYWSALLTRCTGGLLVPLLVALMRPGYDPAEFFLVFPFWLFLEGNLFFLVGSDAGGGYPVALVCYTAAVCAALAPYWGPLILGALVSSGILLAGLYLRLQTE